MSRPSYFYFRDDFYCFESGRYFSFVFYRFYTVFLLKLFREKNTKISVFFKFYKILFLLLEEIFCFILLDVFLLFDYYPKFRFSILNFDFKPKISIFYFDFNPKLRFRISIFNPNPVLDENFDFFFKTSIFGSGGSLRAEFRLFISSRSKRFYDLWLYSKDYLK